jgi:hypothetical protein
VVRSIVATLKAAKAPATYGFINAKGIQDAPETAEFLEIWRAAGHPLGNHTFSHMDLHMNSVEAFAQDTLANEKTLRASMGSHDWHWFRYPYLREGETADKRRAVAAWPERLPAAELWGEQGFAAVVGDRLLYALLESPETARITLPTGETVRPAPGFQCVLTDNAGLKELSPALRDRIDARVTVAVPCQEAIDAFPQALRKIVQDSAKAEGERRISLRSWDALGRLVEGGMALADAGMLVFGEAKWVALETSVKVALAAKA